MPAKEFWAGVALICGALIALGTVAVKTGRAIWNMFEVISQAREFLEEALGDKENGRASMMELLQATRREVEQIKAAHADHMQRYHGEGPVPIASPLRGRRQR